MAAPQLSVVIIARNEESHLGRVLESVLAAVRAIGAEVIVVDSASTDATAAVAKGFPVRVIELDPGWPLSPAAGRHVGFQAASAESVFFLDGDSELEPGFLAAGLRVLAQDARVAAVLGRRREVRCLEDGAEVVAEEDRYAVTGPRRWRPAERIGGSGLYRAAALRMLGGFNPWLCSYEEAELATRLHQAGLHLLFIPRPMITHLDHRPFTVRELRRRWRENLLLGRGQVLRLHPFCRPLYVGLSRVFGMLGCLAALPLVGAAALAGGDARWLAAWPALMAALFAGYTLRSRGLSKPLFYFLAWSVEAVQLVRGFVRRPRDPADYPIPAACSGPPSRALQGGAYERPADNHRLLAG